MIFPRSKQKREMFLGPTTDQMPLSLIPLTRCNITGLPREIGSRCQIAWHQAILMCHPTTSQCQQMWNTPFPTCCFTGDKLPMYGFLLMIVLPIYYALCLITKMQGAAQAPTATLKKTGKILRGWKGNKNILTSKSHNLKKSLTFKTT